jgi:hypothetical protein
MVLEFSVPRPKGGRMPALDGLGFLEKLAAMAEQRAEVEAEARRAEAEQGEQGDEPSDD